DAPVLEQVFSEQEVRPGSSTSLKCSASGNPLPQVTWTLDGAPVPEVYHIRIGDYVSNERMVHSYVNMTSVRVEDGGRYACVARNGVGAAQHSARLNVLGRPLVRPMGNVTALAGRPVTLHCPVAGHPIQSIAWLKDGRSLPQNHRQRTFPNGTLVISDVQRSVDSGWYSCVAQDPEGNSAKGQLALDVMIPPVVNPFAFPSDLTEGKRAGAACIVSDGDLPISVEWRKDGLPLAPALRASVAEANDYTSFLSFAAVRQSHSGNYTCVASNPAASANFTAPMVVQVPPRWRQEPRDRAAIMGQAVVFDCQAEGFPVPVIRWKKAHGGDSGGRDFSVIISNANVQILENGSLSIREADRKDGGQYMCQAINGVGPGISTVVRLDVHVAAHFERKFQALTVRRGESIALTCRAVGEPPITVTWTRDRHGFNPTLEPRYVVEEKPGAEGLEYSVHIPTADRRDSSLFSCYAENAYGRDDTNFQVVVQEPPDKPRSLETTSTTSRAATLVWAPPYSGNSPVLKYLLEYKTESGSWGNDGHLVAVESTELSHVVNTLKPKTTYEFRLRAENVLGLSDYSDSLVLTTDEEAPGGAPRDIKVTPTGSRSLRVSWMPPSEPESQGTVQGYYVGYRVRDSKESYAYKTLEAASTSLGSSSSGLQECDLNDLRKNTRYSVVVQAFNGKGAGPSSEEVFSQTLEIGKPHPPTAPSLKLVSSTSSSVHLSWEVAKEQPISGYVLFQRTEASPNPSALTSESSGEWSEVQMGADRSAYAFRSLGCGRRYAFYAVAFNAAAPVAPEQQDLVTANMTAATLQLSSWKSGGCPISFFVVLYKQQAAREWTPAAARVLPELPQHQSRRQQPQQAQLPATTLVLGDLTPATWYDLLVTAHNEAGSTEAEYVFATLTLSGGTVPPPRSTQAVDSQHRHIRIIVPIVCTLLVMLLVSAVVCYVFSRRRLAAAQRPSSDDLDEPENTKAVDTVPMSVWEKPDQVASREQLYYPSPYAGSRASMYADGAPQPQETWAPTGRLRAGPLDEGDAQDDDRQADLPTQHTYDVPFLRRPPSSQTQVRKESPPPENFA
ncbi:hypothetical protein HPB47_022388, partial [Ixodes persulcatus]